MSETSAAPRGGPGLDPIGALASSLCAVHCAVCAILPTAFAVAGVGFLAGHVAEWAFTLVAVAIASGALVHGFRRHRSRAVALVLVVGIAGLLVSRGMEGANESHTDHPHHASHVDGTDPHAAEAPRAMRDLANPHAAGAAVGVVAGLLLLAGHIMNLRALRRASRCASGHG